MPTEDHQIKIVDVETLSDDWYTLKKYSFDFRRKNGEWQRQTREVYHSGNGATVLLYNRLQRTVVLTRQFRLPAYLNGVADGMLIETPAGLLEDQAPADRIRHEIEEETGYEVDQVTKVFEAYMTPGAVAERAFFFVAEYQPDKRKDAGGGVAAEGEDIEVLELPFDKACEMMEKGEIIDCKTIMLLQYAALNLFGKSGT
ncbi:MAG TPA: NUDIX domain-containing protein [Noviherbaspirillum sp.]|uniref:NUDIX domain-containing protein n=1 Tax=Noviherbaspirillum sp. TaxID=1926288 RepID=UPI002D690464|nr:NUDIX domain-containing protein [Noviherbaspirillum sp.]HYD97240.1 NUDIX domain-containing protein [Noviherbaspirillum sp.]